MLRSMMYNNSVNIVDNYRPVQMLHSRQVKVSFNMSATTTAPPVTMISPSVTTTAPPDTTAAAPDTTTAPPDTTTAPPDTTDGVALKISNVLLLMFLLGVAFFY